MRGLLAAVLALHAPLASVAAVPELPALSLHAPGKTSIRPGYAAAQPEMAVAGTLPLMPVSAAAGPAPAAPVLAVGVAVEPTAAPADPTVAEGTPVDTGGRPALDTLADAGERLAARRANGASTREGRDQDLDWMFELASPLPGSTPAEARGVSASVSPLSAPNADRQDASGAPRPSSAARAPSGPSGWKAAVPDLLTYSNLAGGLAAILLTSSGLYLPAAAVILAALVLDGLDGRAARALGVKNPLGIDMDSLADVVSFGAAPAMLVFQAALFPALGWWGFPIAAAFAAGGHYRLARFNVGAQAEASGAAPPKKTDTFTGLPIPGGAGVALSVSLTAAAAGLSPVALAAVAAAATLLAAGAMVSRLPYPAFKKARAKDLAVPAAVVLSIAAALAAIGQAALIPAALFLLYLASAPISALRARLRR